MPAPVKLDAQMKRELVKAVRRGATITAACEILGITRWAVHLVRQSDPDFDKAIRTAATVLIDRIADVVAEKALSGDLRACEFFLVNRSRQLGLGPEHRWEHVSKIDVGLKVRAAGEERAIEELSDEELHAIIAQDREPRQVEVADQAEAGDPYDGVGEEGEAPLAAIGAPGSPDEVGGTTPAAPSADAAANDVGDLEGNDQ